MHSSTDRRRWSRLPFRHAVEFETNGGDSLQAEAKNISLGGISLVSSHILPFGTRGKLKFALQNGKGEERFRFPGRVVRIHYVEGNESAYLMAVQFCDVKTGESLDLSRALLMEL
jgi:c-di-GMP-binding flagellar brake protein YcgR